MRDENSEDQALLSRISAGDAQALELLYDRYAATVYRLAVRVVKSPELAEEVVQEVFWRVWRRSGSFTSERGRVAQWLFGIAHHLCIDEIRRMRSRPVPVYEDVDRPFLQQIPDEHADVAGAAWNAEQRRALVDALGQLPEAQRQAIELAYFGGLSHQEIATKLDRPLGTVKTRVRLGLHKLNSLLAAQGLQMSDAF
ncbi:MAG TPA: sigma-70 family RNA polymerase sigma factor [Roseiflexaceae bacterium]|jgi:RNA polymerase sigma-70 factor (ECF subfamily)|nr:sigma-70 family RNA polymerase sigma factor [Roseiflexaceae bacterium]